MRKRPGNEVTDNLHTCKRSSKSFVVAIVGVSGVLCCGELLTVHDLRR